MMRISDIETFFEANVNKKSLSLVSLDNANNISLINSENLVFDFDEVNKTIKTSDTIYFKNNKIIFVEFKNGKIKPLEFRLKATESIISFYNFIFDNNFRDNLIFPTENFKIYFVYKKTRATIPMLYTFNSVIRDLNIEYKHLYSSLKIIDDEKFIEIFEI